QCGEDSRTMRFVVVPLSRELEQELVAGGINLREALSRPRAWVFDLRKDWTAERAWSVELEHLPRGVLPRPGVMLYRHLPSVVRQWAPRAAAREIEMQLVGQEGSTGRRYSVRKAANA